jgi:outer membrane protein OmpA-like peptidoglycan-associated protein
MRKKLMAVLAGLLGGGVAWAQSAVQPIGPWPYPEKAKAPEPAPAPAAEAEAPAGPDFVQEAEAEEEEAPLRPMALLLFSFDSSELDPADRSELETAKAWTADHPNQYLVIEGHTDPIGTFDYNAGLATRRAENVRSELLAMGADPDQLVVGVYGEAKPVSDDNAANRRVVVRGTDETLDQITQRTVDEGLAVVWSYTPSAEAVAMRERGRPREETRL